MAEICSCTSGIVNFGQPNCIPSFGRDSRLIFVNYSDDTGAVNSIKSTDILAQTFFDGKFNSTDESQRWYLTDTINNVVGAREDNITQDIDTIPFNVRQGNRMYDGTFYGSIASPTFIDSLESMSCRNMGFFIVTVAGEIIGMCNDSTGELDPIKIQRNTLQTKYMFPTATEVQSINLKFMIEQNERDADLSFIGAENIDVDMLSQIAMSTVTITVATSPAPTVTTATIDMDFLYGEKFDKVSYTGALLADFTMLDTNGVAVVITSVTETATEGTYDLVYPDQTGNTPLSLSYQKVTGAGFETVEDATITP